MQKGSCEANWKQIPMPGSDVQLQVSVRARRHLVSIKATGTRFWGPDQAERYQARIFEIFRLIRLHPEIGVSHEEYGQRIRTFPVEHHIVIYEIDDQNVTVLAVVPPHANVHRELN